VVSELDYAVSRGFVSTYAVETNDQRLTTNEKSLWSMVYGRWSPNDRIVVVQNPVKRPGDDMFIHLDAEDILWTWDQRPETRDPRLELGELAFNVNGKQGYFVERVNAAGEREVYVREALFNAMKQPRNPKSEILNKSKIEKAKAPNKNVSDLAFRVSDFHRVVAAVHESMAFANQQMTTFLSGGGESRGASPESRAVKQAKYFLITPELVEKNYGIARTIGYLASLGSKIFIFEPDQRPEASDQRLKFYRAYGLEQYVNAGQLVSVSGTESEVIGKISQAAKKRLMPEDVIRIGFKSSYSELPAQYSELVLADDLLGTTAAKRADFPVLALASRLMEDPDLAGKLGERIVTKLPDGNRWFLRRTPAGGELSELLASEIESYQAMAAISTAA
jgi:hypothetical protein